MTGKLFLHVKQDGDSLEYASEVFKNHQEIVWISKRYFKLIKSIQTFDLNLNSQK
jgi:hypothetical protein